MSIRLYSYFSTPNLAILVCLFSLTMTVAGCKSSSNDASDTNTANRSSTIDYANPFPAHLNLFSGDATFTASNISTYSLDDATDDYAQHITTTVDANPVREHSFFAIWMLCYFKGNYQQERVDGEAYKFDNIITDKVKACLADNGVSGSDIQGVEENNITAIYQLSTDSDNLIIKIWSSYMEQGKEYLDQVKLTLYQSPSAAKPFGHWRVDIAGNHGDINYTVIDTNNSLTLLSSYGKHDDYDDAIAITKNHTTQTIISNFVWTPDNNTNKEQVVANDQYLYEYDSATEDEVNYVCYDINQYEQPDINFVLFNQDGSYLTAEQESATYTFTDADNHTNTVIAWNYNDDKQYFSAGPLSSYYDTFVDAAEKKEPIGGYYLKADYIFQGYKKLSATTECTDADLSFDDLPDLPTSNDFIAPNLEAAPSL